MPFKMKGFIFWIGVYNAGLALTLTFSPASAAVYQLGQLGTAAKKLKEWDLKP